MFATGITALVLTAGASVSFAAFDVLRKMAAKDIDPGRLLVLQLMGQVPIFGAWLYLSGDYSLALEYFPLGFIAVGIGLAANLIFLKALQLSPLSLTIPALSLTPVITTFFGIWFLKEYPTTVQAVGIGLVCLGVLLTSLRAASQESPGLTRRLRREPGIPLMVIVAVLWSLNGPIHKELLDSASVPMHALFQLSASTILLLLWLLVFGKRLQAMPPTKSFMWAGAASGAGALAYGSQLLAFEVTLVAIVESVKRVVGQISALALGKLAFREPITRAKTGAVAVLCAGVPLILLPL